MSIVTVIIPAHNQARFLGQAIESALGQTHADLELIVVNDGSTDDTREVIRAFADPRLRYVEQENQGLSAARNAGLRGAWGRFVSFLDADDLFLPTKLADLLAALTADPEADLAAGQALPIDEQGHRVGHAFDRPLPADPADLLFGNPLHVGSVLLRRAALDRVGAFDVSLRSYEDWDMWLRLARAGCRLRWVDRPVSLYRFHTHQMTRDGAQMTAASLAVLDKFFAESALPAAWEQRRDRAYSEAYLRAAANAYLAGETAAAQHHLERAIDLQPALLDDDARPLADRFSAWTELPKTGDPVNFLDTIYRHLPPRLDSLRRRRKEEIGRMTLRQAFEAYRVGDWTKTRSALRRLIRYRPAWFVRRGVASILIRSYLSIAG
jgi:glycosyltransferase involved in cell wall biosynthesis